METEEVNGYIVVEMSVVFNNLKFEIYFHYVCVK
jgi:hypothetical protein